MLFINSKSIYFTIFMHILSYHKTHTMSSFLLQYPRHFSQINEKITAMNYLSMLLYVMSILNSVIFFTDQKNHQFISKTTSRRFMHFSISALFSASTGSPEKKYSVSPPVALPLSHLVKRFT